MKARRVRRTRTGRKARSGRYFSVLLVGAWTAVAAQMTADLPQGSDEDVASLLEFLGSWDDGDGNWLDPLSLEAQGDDNDTLEQPQQSKP